MMADPNRTTQRHRPGGENMLARLTPAGRRRGLVVALLLAGLLARVAAVWLAGDRAIPHEFGVLVLNLLDGRGYSYYALDANQVLKAQYLANPLVVLPSAYMPPVYPFFLAGIFSAVGSTAEKALVLAELIQALLGTATCLLVYLTARKMFDERSAWLALAASCVYPLLVFSSSQISAVPVYVFLSQVVLFLALWSQESRTLRKDALLSVLTGLSVGLLVLSRAESLVFAVGLGLWILWRARQRWLPVAGAYALGVALILSPWLVRNYHVFGRLTPLTVSGGYNLWQGQNEQATGTFGGYVVPPLQEPAALRQAIASLAPGYTYELERDQAYMQAAEAFMLAHPGQVAVLALRKLAYFWGGIYFGFQMNYPGVHSPLVLAPWLLMLPFFAFGLARSLRRSSRYLVFYLFLGLTTAIAMLFFVLPRYPIIVIPTVIQFAAYGFTQMPLARRIFP
ncbi:MAG: glycosyltransferase family 39 protein [Anaerolineaceae bacterium]|nr:glycosyltransferase family 39 protein [Anaerolineaceae bacterium]